jgi:type I restriction enzyme S subunit
MSKKKKTIEELLIEATLKKEEQPYEVPENWIWISLKEALKSIQYGYTETSSQKEIGPKFLRITDIQNEEVDWSTVPYCKINELELGKYTLEDNDIVVARTGATTGKSYMLNNPPVSVFASYLIRLRCNSTMFPRYLWEFMKSPAYWRQIMVVKKGSAQPGANAQILGNLAVPLPPFAEQKRIATKVEHLLNKIEEAKRLIEEAKETFELRRAAILDKAFRGKLTRKWRDNNKDFDTLELEKFLENAKAEREHGPFKSNTLNVKPVLENENPFKLPKSWKWVRLGELSYFITSGSREWSKYYSERGAFFIRTQDINKNKLNLKNVAFVSLPEKVEGKRSLVEQFDLLTTITGANVGKCALVEESISEAYVSQSVAITKLVDKNLAKYVHLSLLSNSGGGGELEDRAYGIGRPVLSLEDIKNIKIPIAPTKEREAIVKIATKLLDMGEKANKLINIEDKLDQLKHTILSKAFRGELGTNDPNEESSIELLKEVVQEHMK